MVIKEFIELVRRFIVYSFLAGSAVLVIFLIMLAVILGVTDLLDKLFHLVLG